MPSARAFLKPKQMVAIETDGGGIPPPGM